MINVYIYVQDQGWQKANQEPVREEDAIGFQKQETKKGFNVWVIYNNSYPTDAGFQ